MSLYTYSKFYFGYKVTSDNYYLPIDEGSGEVNVQVDIGSYSMTTLATAIQTSLNEQLINDYTVTVDRDTRKYTISGSANFDILVSSGSTVTTSIFDLIGFTGADRTGTDTYEGDTETGSVYIPQFILQDHIASEDYVEPSQASVNESASGQVEVVRFAVNNFLQFSIKWATNNPMPTGGPITNDAQGVDKLREFMNFLITKSPLEYMADKDNSSVYETIILESTQSNRDGVGFRLNEQYARGLPGFFETGIMKFRILEG